MLFATGALVNDSNHDAVVIGLLVAEFDKLSALGAVIPVFDDSSNVTAVDGLPAASTVAALRVEQIVRGVPGDLDMGRPELISFGGAQSEVLDRGRGFRRLVVFRVFVVMFATTHERTLFELLGCVVVVVFVSDDRVDELERLTVIIQLLRQSGDGRGGGESVLSDSANSEQSECRENRVEECDAHHGVDRKRFRV